MKSAQKMKGLTQSPFNSRSGQAQASNRSPRQSRESTRWSGPQSIPEGADQGERSGVAGVEAIKTARRHQTKSVQQLEEAIEALRRQAEVPPNEVRDSEV